MSDVNTIAFIDNGDDVISDDNGYDNEKDDTKIDEEDELEESIDRLFQKHVLLPNERSSLNETSDNLQANLSNIYFKT